MKYNYHLSEMLNVYFHPILDRLQLGNKSSSEIYLTHQALLIDSDLDLNNLLKRLHRNKHELLRVLDKPWLPLHNNLSESDIREYVQKRKISGGTRSADGRRCRDTFTSLKKTCKKHGISFWKFLKDRIGNLNQIPFLPEIIRNAAHAS